MEEITKNLKKLLKTRKNKPLIYKQSKIKEGNSFV
jgi:hypothetical protein